jgi:hypothetical protein
MSPASARSQASSWSGLVAPLTFLALSAIWLVIAVRYSETGWDFTQFYLVAHLPIHSIHDREVFVQLGERLLGPQGIHYYPPFVRPAVFALAAKPLAWFSYWQAFWIWAGIGFLSYVASILLLRRRFALPEAMLPAFALFFPSLFGIVTGQDANTVLLVLLASILLLLDGRNLVGGLLLALCAYKFNLILFFPLVLLVKARWSALISLVSGVSIAAFASAMLAPASSYLALLRTIPRITIGISFGGLHGVAIGLGNEWWYFPAAAAAGMFCVFLIYKLPMLEAFCVAIVAALLLGYHAAWYDCTLLVIPIAVAFQKAAKATRAALVLILALPGVWAFGGAFVQAMVEIFLLAYFANGAFRAADTAVGSRPGLSS